MSEHPSSAQASSLQLPSANLSPRPFPSNHPAIALSSSSTSSCVPQPPPRPCATTPHEAAPEPFTTLAAFLQQDIDPQDGHRLLLPFLTTMDRLRLSECCQGLLDYRYHLSSVQIVNHPSPTLGNKRGLARLLLDQHQHQHQHQCRRAGGGLEGLRIGHTSMLHVLDLASWGWFEGLKTLDLHGLYIPVDDHLYGQSYGVAGFFVKRGLDGLEKLNLSQLEGVVSELENGCCPGLRRLNLAQDKLSKEWCSIARALETGKLCSFQELNLAGLDMGDDYGAATAKALQGGACPHLVKLALWYCELTDVDGVALGEAMRSGFCAKLEELELGGNAEMNDEGFNAVFGALEAGGCPSFKRLQLEESCLSAASATALGDALRSSMCHQLQELKLGSAFENRDASLQVLQAIQQGGRGARMSVVKLLGSTTISSTCNSF